MKTHPFVHAALAINVFFQFSNENWMAAVGWACCWMSFVVFDYMQARQAAQMVAAKLFIDAYGAKWPNKEAEKQAAEALAAFMKAQKQGGNS